MPDGWAEVLEWSIGTVAMASTTAWPLAGWGIVFLGGDPADSAVNGSAGVGRPGTCDDEPGGVHDSTVRVSTVTGWRVSGS